MFFKPTAQHWSEVAHGKFFQLVLLINLANPIVSGSFTEAQFFEKFAHRFLAAPENSLAIRNVAQTIQDAAALIREELALFDRIAEAPNL